MRTTASKLAAHAIVTRGEELALRGTNDSSYSHPPRLASSSPWLSPLGNRRGPKGVEGACSTVWKPPTIFHDRNLILSDVNQRRERKREREKGNIPELSHKAPLPFQRFFFSLSLSRLVPFSSSIHLFQLAFSRRGDNFHNYWTMIDSREIPGFSPSSPLVPFPYFFRFGQGIVNTAIFGKKFWKERKS